MIKTLVAIEIDLASSLAIRFACQLGGLMNMQIQPVYVKDSHCHDSVLGAGWASRTWEKEMVQQGTEEIAQLVAGERDSCPILEEPKVIYGDREGELLKIAQAEQFDVFIEGAHFPRTAGGVYKRLHTRLYQKIGCPVILVRALRKIEEVQLLCLDIKGTETLANIFRTIWHDCPLPLVLSYSAEATVAGGTNALREAVERACSHLEKAGCTVTIQDRLSGIASGVAAEIMQDCGLIAIAVERAAK